MIDWLTRKQKVKIEGKYHYYLNLNTEFVDSSTSISITCFTDKTKKAAVPCNYIWFAIKNGLPLEVQDFKGSTFICDTNHIGYFIQAHIVSNDPDFSGKAIVTFGPVELDISLKTDILKGLLERSVSQPIYLVNSEGDEKQCQLRLQESQMRIEHSFSDTSYTFDYSILEPQITIHPKQVTKISILFNEKYETDMKRFQRKLFHPQDLSISHIHSHSRTTHSQNIPKLEVKFLNRSARDVFLFAMKAFITKREMKNSAVLRKIQNINFQNQEDFTAILELQSLRRDLIRYDTLYKQSLADRKRAMDDLSKIQALGNPKANSSHFNYSTQQSGRRDEPTLKFQQLEKENKQLNGRINHLMDEIDAMRVNQSVLSGQVGSPYAKKKREYDNESLASLMDGLTAQVCHFDADRDSIIDNLKSQKKELEAKMDRYVQQIQLLEKKLKQVPIAPLPVIQSGGINFTYRTNPNEHSQDHLRLIDTLKRQLQDLKKANQTLQNDNRRLASQLQSKNRPVMAYKIESHLSKIRQQNKTTDLLIQSKQQQQKMDKLTKQNETLKETLKSKTSQIESLKKEVSELTRIKVSLEQRCLRSERRSNELQMELEIFKRNQDVLNRSQNISMQMDNYNEEQIRILKEHNGFLVSENQKLVKACEKYMSDAKQSNKLRQEILTLKEKMNQMLTNPQAHSFQ